MLNLIGQLSNTAVLAGEYGNHTKKPQSIQFCSQGYAEALFSEVEVEFDNLQ
jgi:hypothetical protein